MSTFLVNAALALGLLGGDPTGPPTLLLVVGAPGDPEYGQEFRSWADRWAEAGSAAGATVVRIGDDEPEDGDRDRLREALATATDDEGALWIVLIGHGTFDGRESKFNLRGPDVTAAEMAEWLGPIDRPVAIVNCASASGPFVNACSKDGRVVVTATRSGDEQNYARFGRYLAGSIADPAADLDKDDQVSLLEAFLTASGRLDEYYRTEARLATEHPLIDDNGDGLGTPADWFRGVRAVKRAAEGAEADGLRAHQLHLIPSDRERSMPAALRGRRDRLEAEIASLRDRKEALGEDAYYDALEPLMIELARLYRSVEASASGDPASGDSAAPD